MLLWLCIRTKGKVRSMDAFTGSIYLFIYFTLALSDILQGFIKKAINQPGVVRQAQVTADYVFQQTS